ncbi:MAG: hypothetical protein ACUVQ0_04875 [Thermoproteota archaeon]
MGTLKISIDEVEKKLRSTAKPIYGSIKGGTVVVEAESLEELAQTLRSKRHGCLRHGFEGFLLVP